jgi:hypothetical protein
MMEKLRYVTNHPFRKEIIECIFFINSTVKQHGAGDGKFILHDIPYHQPAD